uniref:Uncharacterized protein n=1 Tax=Lygus hesperus TaxID=30085 RepID=A0A0A9WWZ2_LYGHE
MARKPPTSNKSSEEDNVCVESAQQMNSRKNEVAIYVDYFTLKTTLFPVEGRVKSKSTTKRHEFVNGNPKEKKTAPPGSLKGQSLLGSHEGLKSLNYRSNSKSIPKYNRYLYNLSVIRS